MENRVVKVFAITLAIILIVTIISFLVMTILGRGKNYQVKLLAFGNKTKLIASNEYSVSEVGKIQIDAKSSNVKIVEGAQDKIRVMIYGTEGEKYNIDNINNELKISKDSNVFYLVAFFCFIDKKIVVEVPSTYDGNIRNKHNKWKHRNRRLAKW